MKLFHKERGKDVVYVQMQDLQYLARENDSAIPESIFEKITPINYWERMGFVKFKKKDEVEFFRKVDYIPDYDLYKDLTEEELGESIKNIDIKIDEIARIWNSMSSTERANNAYLLQEHTNKKYMLKSVSLIYGFKCGNIEIPFPEFEKKAKKRK